MIVKLTVQDLLAIRLAIRTKHDQLTANLNRAEAILHKISTAKSMDEVKQLIHCYYHSGKGVTSHDDF